MNGMTVFLFYELPTVRVFEVLTIIFGYKKEV